MPWPIFHSSMGKVSARGRAESQNACRSASLADRSGACGFAVTAEETEYARDAQRLADHEVDQAFASALREAARRNHVLTGEALTLSQKSPNSSRS